MNATEATYIDCPYCGERIEIVIDCSVEHQEYVEDCAVCCRPITLTALVDEEAVVDVSARCEDES